MPMPLEERRVESAEMAQPSEQFEEISATEYTDASPSYENMEERRVESAEMAQPSEQLEKTSAIKHTDALSSHENIEEQRVESTGITQPSEQLEKTSAIKHTDASSSYENIEFEITRNSRVEHYIRLFSSKKAKKNFAEILRRSGRFLPEIKEILYSEGIPSDIAYLPLIESGFNPQAVSRRNAVGMWQFIKPTGLRYGLRINPWVDERMDVKKSTLAATRYLKKLFDDFGSWELALAAYNCGEARVSKAIAKTGSTNFWIVSKKLPRETRNYVPKFNAALIIAKNPEMYGFKTIELNKDYETVSVPPRKSLAQIAKLLNIKDKKIYSYNPSLVGLSTPPGGSYELVIPKDYVEKFPYVQSEIALLKDINIPFRTKPTIYTVKPDDSLWKIGRKFGISIKKLKYANRLSGSIIRPGQKLMIPSKRGNVIYVKHRIRPGENIYVLAKRYGTSVDEIKRVNNLKGSLIIAGKTLSIPQRLSSIHSSWKAPRKMNHRIILGDTLSELALRYRVSVSQIKKWNNMSSTTLIAGRNLVIYK